MINLLPSKVSMKKLKYHNYPKRITFDTNPGICNLNCIMCDTHSLFFKDKRPKTRIPVMDFELVKSIIYEGVEHGLKEVIPSTMGEPLLYKHMEEMFLLAKETGIHVNLTTNGTFPRLGVEKWSEFILPVTSDIKISFNGVSAEINQHIMKGIDHQKQVNDIRKLVALRNKFKAGGKSKTTITLQLTLMEYNLSHLKDIVFFAEELGIDRVKAHHLWVTSPEIEDQNLRRSEESVKSWNAVAKELKNLSSNLNVRLENMDEISLDGEHQRFADDMVCPFLGREAWISADGKFNVCCCPDELRKQFGRFGNVKKDKSLYSLWSSSQYKELVANWGEHENCQKCNMRRKIEG